MWKPVPLPDGSYADASRPFSDQDVVNYWTEYPSGQGTRSKHKLVQLPGLRPFLDFGAGPHRGIRNVEGVLYLCADTHAYKVDTDGTVTQLGSIPGRGRVWISHNQNLSGAVRQVMFSTGPEGWIWDVAAQTFTQISDSAFHGARSLIYLNSRFLGIEQQRRYFANSSLTDGLEWDSTETYQAESAPDRLVALEVFAGEVLAFNERTLEFFQNTTNSADIANHIYFTRVGPPVQIGAASQYAVSVLDNRVFFVGSDGAGYYMSGYTPIRVTTPAIDTAWAECDISKAFSFTYISRGHSVWYVTFPDGRTWGYDCATEKWHRRQTIGLDRWRLNTLVPWNGDYYGGAYNSGILYKVDWTYEGLEGCDEIVREFTTGVLHDEGNRVTLDGVRIECDTGYGTTDCGEADPVTPVFPPDSDGDIAQGLALDIEHWWGMDGDLIDDEPASPVAMTAYSALPLYQAGVNGQEAQTRSHIGAFLNNGGVASDCSFWFWIHAIGTAAGDRTQVALADAVAAATPRVGASIYSAGTELRVFVDDNDDADVPDASGTIAPGGTYFVVVNLNWAAKTVDLYVDGVFKETSTPVNNFWTDMVAMIVRANNGNEDTDAVDWVSQLGFMRRLATVNEITYLYNNGDGKTYADLITDGALA